MPLHQFHEFFWNVKLFPFELLAVGRNMYARRPKEGKLCDTEGYDIRRMASQTRKMQRYVVCSHRYAACN